MTLGFEGPLYILAFDHRSSSQKRFFGVAGEPNEQETAKAAWCRLAMAARRADRTSSISSTAMTSARTSRRSTRPSRRCWSATSRRAMDGLPCREEAGKQIAANYRRFIDVYEGG